MSSCPRRIARVLPALVALLLGAVFGCDAKKEPPPTSRFAGVARQPSAGAAQAEAGRFCDRSYGPDDATERAYQPAPLRALPGAAEEKPATGWRWINAWATWCAPCVEEMGVLLRWREALRREGVVVDFELLSIDTEDQAAELRRWVARNLPGQVQWLRSEQDFGPWLTGLGVDQNAAIPIHALVDPAGRLRCVRVGAVHEQDFGAVRAILKAR